MIKEKRLLISDCCVEEDEFVIEIEAKLKEFVELTFGKDIDVEFEVFPSYQEEPRFSVDAFISITFNDYTWVNGLGDTRQQTLGIVLEDKGFQAFWIDGKFIKKFVYEWCSGMPIQGDEKINGIGGYEALRLLEEFVLTC